ncbi:hypothetical protein SAMN04487926_12167 [Paraburkholderia steynii]|uniref:Uncharacterized protein n=1 Tax=Paraburkholderia steynii TaxID=1245441 RepID=A0A7Z7BC03_9BURK|nr:hypothetical protein [Paraburkholderia steynii]SDI65534.1 hypothetical protein SAMN04487926_12167 [Paraburkholderia steynii]
MNWSDLKGVVSKAAPVVGTLLGGPAGAAVGGLIAAALGTDSTPDAVSAALIGNPDAIVKIQELQTNAKVQLQQLAVTAEANRLADVQNARSRQTANPRDYTPQVLAAFVTVGFFGTLGLVMFAHMESAAQNLLLVMTGTLQTAWVAIISYYFGSSKDSAGKTQMIADVGYAAAAAPINVTTSAPAAPAPQSDIYRGS